MKPPILNYALAAGTLVLITSRHEMRTKTVNGSANDREMVKGCIASQTGLLELAVKVEQTLDRGARPNGDVHHATVFLVDPVSGTVGRFD